MNIQLSMIGLFLLACNSDESIKVFNSDPEATITSHTEGSELLEAVEYTFVGQVNDANHQNEELLVTWSTNNKELCAQAAASTTGESSCQAALELGDNELRIQVTDPEGAASLTSISITIIETNAPTITLSAPLENTAY